MVHVHVHIYKKTNKCLTIKNEKKKFYASVVHFFIN